MSTDIRPKKKRKKATTSSSTPDNQCASNHLTAEVLAVFADDLNLNQLLYFHVVLCYQLVDDRSSSPAFGGEKKGGPLSPD